MAIDHEAVKARLHLLMERRDLKENAFAEAIDISQSTVNGQFARTSFSADLLSRAADLFGVTLDWLMDGREPRWRSLAGGRLVAPAPEELDHLAAVLGEAGAVVKEMRDRYGTTPPPAGVDVDELVDVIRQLEGAARDELLKRAAELPPQVQVN